MMEGYFDSKALEVRFKTIETFLIDTVIFYKVTNLSIT